MLQRYIGDKAFYRRVLAIAIPIMIQNGITNFVSLLDNIMVGQIGTIQMSGVSIANQLIFVFNLCVFGATSGAGIFTSQFYGTRDHKGIRYTLRFKILSCLALTALCLGIFLAGGKELVGLYLQGDGDPAEAALTLKYGMSYLHMMLIGLLPFALCNAYASTLRETGQTIVPMVGGIVAVFVNLFFNYVLIFGKFGFAPMGVEGAALATVISRFVELGIMMIWSHLHTKEHPCFQGIFRSLHIPGHLLKSIILKGMPLLVNELLWSTGIAFINQCYSTCSLDVVPATNIANTLKTLSAVAFVAMGNAVGIMMGQMLGSDQPETAVRDTNRKLTALAMGCGALFGLLMVATSGLFPLLYNTTDSVRQLSTTLICILGLIMPFNAYVLSAYYTLRSGGQTMITFIFDSCFVWGCSVPLAFILSRFLRLPIVPLFILCESVSLLKCLIGMLLVKQGKWIKNLTKT